MKGGVRRAGGDIRDCSVAVGFVAGQALAFIRLAVVSRLPLSFYLQIDKTAINCAHMKTKRCASLRIAEHFASLIITLTTLFGLTLSVTTARADETCSSPYLARIEGQEEFVYVWTLGVEGLGDGSDKLVVVDVKPDSPTYGKVINSRSVGGRNEAH